MAYNYGENQGQNGSGLNVRADIDPFDCRLFTGHLNALIISEFSDLGARWIRIIEPLELTISMSSLEFVWYS
ncbi:hypothetical protein IEQ34_020324 [Dendrobium chrysotoxum]|uniref:Uncharacterized protein n=1 Tax=Dendrobium chrysotoxum TaxID=161865 RepID=A0AAV7G1R3_DENCH|nr:hypothetical protein IEQ34_020324 [Dendrobium chrysotoxum]